MAGIDIFNSDAFSAFELVGAYNRDETIPEFLGSLGIFEPEPVRTRTIAIEERGGTLSLIPTSPIGSAPTPGTAEGRNIRDFRTVRLAKDRKLYAHELQDMRGFGQVSELQDVQNETARRLDRLQSELRMTNEHMRLGAVQGVVYDADNATVIRDWYSEWGISVPTETDWDLDNATPASGAVRKLCTATVRAMQRAASGSWIPNSTYVMGLCGDAFFDDLTATAEVRGTYLNQQEARDLRGGLAFESLQYGGITFVNYRGTDDNSKVAIGTDKVRFFPVNAPGVFKWAMSPPEWLSGVNMPGQMYYPLIVPDRDRGMWVSMEMYSYPLPVCTRPQMLLRGKRT